MVSLNVVSLLQQYDFVTFERKVSMYRQLGFTNFISEICFSHS